MLQSFKILETIANIKQLSKFDKNWERVYRGYLFLVSLGILLFAIQFIVDIMIIVLFVVSIYYIKTIGVALWYIVSETFKKPFKMFI